MKEAKAIIIEKTPLDQWVAEKIGLPGEKELTGQAIKAYQGEKLLALFHYARDESPFYRELYRHLGSSAISGLEDLPMLPLINATDLVNSGSRMVCVSQKEISRIVTLETTGTTGQPKRVYFTAADQELTVDFFHRGMLNLIGPSDHLLILLPCERPGSVGDLLQKGVGRIGASVTCYGLVDRPEKVIDIILEKGITSLVGVPVQVLSLACVPAADQVRLGSVLLSTDYVAGSLVGQIKRRFGCPVFEHYGMTETGLGGAVSCRALSGYHPRAADLIYEVIDPKSGEVLPDGEQGEIVVTTLTRRGMPFLRYRTGDRGLLLAEPCPCGSLLPRLGKVLGRYSEDVTVSGQSINMPELDELIFAIDGVVDYQAAVEKEMGRERILLKVFLSGSSFNAPVRILYKGIELCPGYESINPSRAPVYRKRKFSRQPEE